MNKLFSSLALALTAVPVAKAAAAVAASGTAAQKQKPNILLIMVDDLGFGDLSCQYAKDMHTPNLDALFAKSLAANDCHANSAVSSPSRAGLLTGRYPDMVGVPGVIRTQPLASWGYLSPKAVLLPQMLKKAGYTTALIGKWHLGLESPNLPNERGFDMFHGFLGDMMDDYYTHRRGGLNLMRYNRQEVDPKGHATEVFTQWTIDYLNRQKNNKAPFFLLLTYNAPHYPLQPPQEWLDRVLAREAGINPIRAKLVALIEHLDSEVGKVLSTLESTGQMDNTIIVFTSDNGGHAPSMANNGPTRGAKSDMYEGGIKVPFCIYWKERIKPRRTDNFLILSDLFPTFCDILSIPIRHEIDGMSLWPLFRDGEQVTDDRYVIWSLRAHGDMLGKTSDAVRYKGYKLLQNRPDKPYELFDLHADPLESNPLEMKGQIYTGLVKQLIYHYNMAGSVPYQAPGRPTTVAGFPKPEGDGKD